MAEIKMTRVDFRLVHGQIVVKWCKACDVDKIVVIDDVVASVTMCEHDCQPFLSKKFNPCFYTKNIILETNTSFNLFMRAR